MSDKKPVEIRVSVDVGYRRHSVAIGLSSGEVLEEFEIAHRPEGFEEFFSRIEEHQKGEEHGIRLSFLNNLTATLHSFLHRRMPFDLGEIMGSNLELDS